MKIYNTGKKILLYRLKPYIKNIRDHSIVLDVGCGTGDMTRFLSGIFKNIDFIGEEVHKETLQYAKQFQQKNLKYILGNGKVIPLKDKSVDLVYSTSVIEHVNDDSRFVKEINRILKKGSIFIVTTLNRDVVPFKDTNPDHKRHYTLKELKALLESGGFKVLKVEYRWSKIGRNLDMYLNSLKDKVFKPKTYQPCITAIDWREKRAGKTKVIFFLIDHILDPLITAIALVDFKLNGHREKFDMMLTCQKIK